MSKPANNPEQTLERISVIRDRFVKGGALEQDIETVNGWRKEFKRALLKINLKKTPAMKMLIRRSVDAIRVADQILTTDKELPEADRKIVFLKKEYHQDFLDFFDQAEVQAAAIEAQVEDNSQAGDESPDEDDDE